MFSDSNLKVNDAHVKQVGQVSVKNENWKQEPGKEI